MWGKRSRGIDWNDSGNRAYRLVREAERDWIRADKTHGSDSAEALDAKRFLDKCKDAVRDQRGW
jgi:hypothetical protein